jgi:hypothetical protein
MPDEHTVMPATVKGEQRSQITSMSPHRLDTARARIDGVCTEYNHFNPSCFVTETNTSKISCAEAEDDQRFRSPNAHQLGTDLQVLFERFLALESDAADNACQRISLRAWEAANDEYGAFDWENLKEIIEDEVEELNEHGCQVDVSDLVTLRTMTACL